MGSLINEAFVSNEQANCSKNCKIHAPLFLANTTNCAVLQDSNIICNVLPRNEHWRLDNLESQIKNGVKGIKRRPRRFWKLMRNVYSDKSTHGKLSHYGNPLSRPESRFARKRASLRFTDESETIRFLSSKFF